MSQRKQAQLEVVAKSASYAKRGRANSTQALPSQSRSKSSRRTRTRKNRRKDSSPKTQTSRSRSSAPRKQGPRDIGRNNDYKGIEYTISVAPAKSTARTRAQTQDTDRLHKKQKAKKLTKPKAKTKRKTKQIGNQSKGANLNVLLPGQLKMTRHHSANAAPVKSSNTSHGRKRSASGSASVTASNSQGDWKLGFVFFEDTYPTTPSSMTMESKIAANGTITILPPTTPDTLYWFESPHACLDPHLTVLIGALPSSVKQELNDVPMPVDEESTVMFLKKLRSLVMKEIQRLHKEDQELDVLANEIRHDFELDLERALEEVLSEVEDDLQQHDHSLEVEQKVSGLDKEDSMRLNVNIDDAIGGIIDDDADIADAELPEVKYASKQTKTKTKKKSKKKKAKAKSAKRRKKGKKATKAKTNTKKVAKNDKEREMGLFQRKLLTMHAVNGLTDMIDDMEQEWIVNVQ